MKLIKDVYDLVFFLAGKNVATKYAPERIDTVFYEVIIAEFNEFYDHYVKTQKISDFLLPYKRLKITNLTGGIATLPEDYAFTRIVTLPDGTQIDLIEDKFWAKRIKRRVGPVSATRPICRIDDTGEVMPTKVLKVLPNDTVQVYHEYFKTPARPVYAYNVDENRYVYDDATSTDVEFGPMMLPNLQLKLLGRLGFNLRTQDIVNFSEQMRQKENTK